MKKKIREYFKLKVAPAKEAQALTVLLVLSYLLSLLAEQGWFFDLFSHFTIQYAVGAFMLGIALFLLKSRKFALLAFTILALNLYEIYRHADFFYTQADEGAETFTVVQYNRHFRLFDYTDPKAWVTANTDNFDLLVFQEASARAERLARDTTQFYPHNILEARNNPFGMVVLSKYPIMEQELIDLGEFIFIRSFALRIVVKPSGFQEPVEIYALHAVPPVDASATTQRNHEVLTLARRIAASEYINTIMIGDWNLTPYSPYFHQLVTQTGLREALWFGLLPMPTWPAQFVLPILQIPIDHIMYRGKLKAVNLKRGPAMGSDHYPVIATFALPPL